MFELAKEMLTNKKAEDQERIALLDQTILAKTEKLQLERSELMKGIKAIEEQLIEIAKVDKKQP